MKFIFTVQPYVYIDFWKMFDFHFAEKQINVQQYENILENENSSSLQLKFKTHTYLFFKF